MIKIKPAQSILEYAILIAIVIAAIVVMQVYMKRGISGRLKESSDKISGGEAFSASNTTTLQRSTTSDRNIIEVTATDEHVAGLTSQVNYQAPDGATGTAIISLKDTGSYSAGRSTAGTSTSNSMSRTDSAASEAFKARDLKSPGAVDGDFKTGGTQQ